MPYCAPSTTQPNLGLKSRLGRSRSPHCEEKNHCALSLDGWYLQADDVETAQDNLKQAGSGGIAAAQASPAQGPTPVTYSWCTPRHLEWSNTRKKCLGTFGISTTIVYTQNTTSSAPGCVGLTKTDYLLGLYHMVLRIIS